MPNFFRRAMQWKEVCFDKKITILHLDKMGVDIFNT